MCKSLHLKIYYFLVYFLTGEYDLFEYVKTWFDNFLLEKSKKQSFKSYYRDRFVEKV